MPFPAVVATLESFIFDLIRVLGTGNLEPNNNRMRCSQFSTEDQGERMQIGISNCRYDWKRRPWI